MNTNFSISIHSLSENDIAKLLPPDRLKTSHKYSFGRLQLMAGSLKYPGAALLCALGAYKAGCGYVSLHTSAPIDILKQLPEIVLGFFPESDAFVIGPGIESFLKKKSLTKLIKKITQKKPILLDGSALEYFSHLDSKRNEIVLTPHEMEFSKLCGPQWPIERIKADRLGAVTFFVEKYPDITLLLKGSTSIIYSEGTTNTISFGTVGMATAGQGDLLTGVIGAYLALGLSPKHSTILGASLCAMTASALIKNGEAQGVLAHEVAEGLPFEIARIRKISSQ